MNTYPAHDALKDSAGTKIKLINGGVIDVDELLKEYANLLGWKGQAIGGYE